MSGGSKTQTATSTTALPKEQQTNVNMLMQGARDLFASGGLGPTPFTQQGYANIDPSQTLGRQLGTEFATSPEMRAAQEQARLAGSSNAYFMDPNILAHPENTPGYQAMAGDITSRLNQNLMEGVLPGVNSEAVLSGDVGGSRQGVAQGLAAGRTQDAIGSSLGQLLGSTYNTLANRNQAAVGMAPGLFQLGQASGMAPFGILEQMGGLGRSEEQMRIDDARRIQAERDAQRIGNISNFQGLSGGQYGGTQTQTTPGTSQSPLNQLLGLGLGVGSMFIPGAQPLGMAAIGSSLGSMLGSGSSSPGYSQWNQPIQPFSRGPG
jgi:hypothetical protein